MHPREISTRVKQVWGGLSTKAKVGSALAVAAFFFGTIGRLNIEKWAEDRGYDKLYKVLQLPDWFVSFWSYITGPFGLGFVLGALIFAFWDPAARRLGRRLGTAAAVLSLRSPVLPTPVPIMTAMEAEAARRDEFLRMRRELEETTLGADGTLVVIPIDADRYGGSSLYEMKMTLGESIWTLKIGKGGGIAIWAYAERDESLKALSHLRQARRGELIDTRNLRPVRNSVSVMIGERIFMTTVDQRVIQALLVGVLDYESGDNTDEVRLRYKIYEPGEFLIPAM